MDQQIIVQKFLRDRLAEQQRQNPRYSLRSFADRIGIHSGALSALLNGKRTVSNKIIERIADRLALDPEERAKLLVPGNARKNSLPDAFEDELGPEYLRLSASQFKVIAEWKHKAILSLLETADSFPSVRSIADRLGISDTHCLRALDRLSSLELIERRSNGNYERTKTRIRTTDGVFDSSIRKAHDESLELARRSLHSDSVGLRDVTSITMAINPKKFAQAQAMIRKFQDELASLLETGVKTEVYRLTTALYPLTQIKSERKK